MLGPPLSVIGPTIFGFFGRHPQCQAAQQDDCSGTNMVQLLPALLVVVAVVAPVHCSHEDCICILPAEEDLCREGAESMMESILGAYAADLNSLTREKQIFWKFAVAIYWLLGTFNCNRKRAVNCFEGMGIRLNNASRGNCDGGKCCQAIDLCPIERIMYFITLGMGLELFDDENDCESPLDYFGQDAGCSWLTDGLSNDAIVCNDANVSLDDTHNFCDVSFAATNDIVDVLRYTLVAALPQNRVEISFDGVDGNRYSFSTWEQIAQIVLGPKAQDGLQDGIVGIVFDDLESKGCFTRANAGISINGLSLGAIMVNVLALKIAAAYPDLPIKMITTGEPGFLAEPLRGAASAHPMWHNKTRFINGIVAPMSNAIKGFGNREYGLYQAYDPVPQLVPTGFFCEGPAATQYFMCEVLVPTSSPEYYLAGSEGCAASRVDVLNPMPNFPHRGFQNNFVNKFLAMVFRVFLGFMGRLMKWFTGPDTDTLIGLLSLWLSLTDINLLNDFVFLADLHLPGRWQQWWNVVTQNGSECGATSFTSPMKPTETCPL